MSPQTASDIVLWEVILGTPPQIGFLLIYSTTAPWWQTAVGRALFTKGLAVTLLLSLSLIGYWWPNLLAVWVGPVVVGLVSLGAWLQCMAIVVEKLRPTSPESFGTRHRAPSVSRDPAGTVHP